MNSKQSITQIFISLGNLQCKELAINNFLRDKCVANDNPKHQNIERLIIIMLSCKAQSVAQVN